MADFSKLKLNSWIVNQCKAIGELFGYNFNTAIAVHFHIITSILGFIFNRYKETNTNSRKLHPSNIGWKRLHWMCKNR
jgi:hypothetical protein